MRTKITLFIVLSILTLNIQAATRYDMEQHALIFPAENIASSESNTGEVHLSILKDGGNTMITNFRFSPGSRNFWHYHPNAEQTLLVLDGEGFYQEEGKEAIEMKPGDCINIPAEVKHWHGAAADSWFSHLAVEVPGEETSNEWCEPVSDEEYGKLK